MTHRAHRRFALLLPLLLLPAAAPAKGGLDAADLGCAVAKAVEVGSLCQELSFFKHEGERRMGEELAALLEAPARARALKLVEAELAEKGRKPGADQACPAARPLCAFPDAALAALKEGLTDSK